ncbi:MAG: proton-conducting transporter membrane subunit [Nanoarchaeota archaeon]
MFSFYAILILLASAFATAVIGIKREGVAPYIAIASTFTALVLTLLTLRDVIANRIVTMQIGGWLAPYGITVVMDPLSIVITSIVATIGFFAALVSFRFVEERKVEYYTLFSLIMVGILGVLHAGDMFNLFVFIEILSIASYSLVAYHRDKISIEASIKYLIMSSFATGLILLSIAFIYGLTGTLNMADIALKLGTESGLLPIIFGLLLTGFGFKAALVPFHAWKPDAVMGAPAPIGAIFVLASLAGVYAIFRMFFTVFFITNISVYYLIIGLSVATMIVGAILALQQTDILRLLAYASISQVGYIFLAFGIGALHGFGYTAAIFHLINVAIFDSLLFFCAAVLIHGAGSSDMHKISQSVRFSPILGYSFMIGMLAAVGVPLLNGFASKWIIYITTLYVQPLLTIIALLVSVLTLAYGVKAFYIMFLTNSSKKRMRIPITMLVPILILVAACVFLGIYPQLGVQISEFVVKNLANIFYIGKVFGI